MPLATSARVPRRVFFSGIAAGTLTAILAACGDSIAPTATTAPTSQPAAPSLAAALTTVTTAATTAPTIAPTTGVATVATAVSAVTPAPPPAATAAMVPATAPAATMSRGEFKLAVGNDFPTKLDALKFANVSLYGMSEMLNRLTPTGKVEPWLAESVVNVNPTTWRVTLRQNVKFWDGSPLVAEDVIAAFRKNWEAYPNANGLISKETKLTAVDARTVEFVTPQPTGIFPGALTQPLFAIHKPAMPGGADGSIFTGPYRPTSFTVDNQLVLEPFREHWAGVPPIAKVTVRNVADANTRALALQSGDVNALYGLPPEAIKTFGSDIEASAIPSGRVHFLTFNVNRAPFNGRAVREATAWALDRAALNTVTLDGKGAPALGMFPQGLGFDVVPLQGTDVNRAKQLLDDAGWKAGQDGVRVKDGKRLSFTILTYPGRAEITQLGVATLGQLKPLGYDIPKIQEVMGIEGVTKMGDWDLAVYSSDMFGTGDPLYGFNRVLAKGGGNNLANYTNPQIESLLDQLRVTIDPKERQAISRQVQEVVKADVPMAFLVSPPVVTAFKKGLVKGYTPNPSDQFFLTAALSVS